MPEGGCYHKNGYCSRGLVEVVATIQGAWHSDWFILPFPSLPIPCSHYLEVLGSSPMTGKNNFEFNSCNNCNCTLTTLRYFCDFFNFVNFHNFLNLLDCSVSNSFNIVNNFDILTKHHQVTFCQCVMMITSLSCRAKRQRQYLPRTLSNLLR